MSAPGFDEAVQRVIAAIAPELRHRTEADVAALRDAGRLTWDRLVATIADGGIVSDLRQAAAWLLGRLERPEALGPLVGALGDADPALRAEAARALGSLADPAAVAPLAGNLRDDRDPSVRAAAAEALGLIGDAAAVDPLLATLADVAETAEVRGHAAEALLGPREPRAIAPLIAALADPSPELRYWCAFALGELGAHAALPALERVAADDPTISRHGSVADEARAAIAAIRGSG